MGKPDYRELRSLLNKYVFTKGKIIQYNAELLARQKEITDYLKNHDMEEFITTIQGEKVLVRNNTEQRYIIKDDAGAIVRRSVLSEYFPLVLHEKEFVDMDVLVKLIDGGKISRDILKLIRTTEDVTQFYIKAL